MKLALVSPWFGRDLIGGAERHAWELAHALAAAGAEVDVLSTCCRSFHDDWATNFHRSGVTVLGDRLRLLRFRVDSRDRVAFGRVTSALTALPQITLRGDYVPLDERDARTFVGESINSRALAAHVREHADAYDAVLFMPYVYGTTLAILPQIAAKSFLIPCLHDEAYAYMEPVRTCIAQARGLLFNSLGEEETAAAIYGPGIYAKSSVVGEAVEPVPPPRAPIRIGGFAPNRSRYVLYLGRQVVTKNIDFLIAAYELFRERRAATSLQLVLAGPTNVSRSDDGIVDLGPVSEEAKAALLTYARALAQPSVHESFSRAVYESWFAQRPVFVHGGCRATARAVEDSGGGWIGSSLDDWARMFAELDESADEAVDAVGRRGFAAALENGNWETVARRVLDAIAAPTRHAGERIEQVVPLGDRAISAYAGALADALAGAGFATDTTIAGTGGARAGVRTIVHVAGDALAPAPGTIAIEHRDGVARLEEGGVFARVLPQPVSPARWLGLRPRDASWNDGAPTILSISSLDATAVRCLLDVFVAFLGHTSRARLLVFAENCTNEARDVLLQERAELDLASEVRLLEGGLDEQYMALRSAGVALALGTSLDIGAAITALWFDLPIVTQSDAAVAGILDTASLMVDFVDPHRLGALLHVLVSDVNLRHQLIAEGRRVRERFSPRVVSAMLLEALQASRPTQLPTPGPFRGS